MQSGGSQATKLNDLDTRSVDLVTRGANKKRFALKKGDTVVTVQEALIQILKDGFADEQDWGSIDKMCAEAGLDAQGAETYKALVKLSAAYKDSPAMAKMVGDHLSKLFGAGGGQPPALGADKPKDEPALAPGADKLVPPAPGADKPTEDTGNKPAQPPADQDGKEKPMSTQKADSAGAQQATDAGKLPSAEELQKSIDAQVSKAVAEAVAKTAEANAVVVKGLQDKLNEQADKASKAEWVRKADKDLQGVPGKSVEELGAMLFELEKSAGAKVAEGQFDVLKGASAAVLKSAAFMPAGSIPRHANTDDAEAKITAAATAVVKSAEGGISGSAAIRKAMEENPSLYAEYLNQHPGQTGGVKYSR